MSEREEAGIRERDYCHWEIIFMFSSFILVLILSLRKLQGFLLYGFLKENPLCILSLMLIFVHVILSDKILR